METGLSWMPCELRGFDPRSCCGSCLDEKGDTSKGRWQTTEGAMGQNGYLRYETRIKTAYMRTVGLYTGPYTV
jgi:hypothetical protein